MQKHTPGPWAIIDDVTDAAIGYRAIVAIDGENFGETICNPSPMGEANARLIAAAPELLAALQSIAERLENLQKTIGWMEQERGNSGAWAGPIVQAAEDTARAAIAKVIA